MFDAGKVGFTMEGLHDSTQAYDRLSVVSNVDSSKLYISKKDVPTGTLLTNTEYWQEVLNTNFTDVAISNSISMGRKADTTVGTNSVAVGTNVEASGNSSHAEGGSSTASGLRSHAEGFLTIASKVNSHAEGTHTTASGDASHAEGLYTIASGYESHAEGNRTTASGEASHASGTDTIASSDNQTVIGKYNIEDTEGKYAFIIGNGTDNDNRSNALAIKWDGTIVTSNF